MVIEHGGRGQDKSPNIPNAPETTQPDQAKLEKQRAYNRAYYHTHREQAIAKTRKWQKQHRELLNQRARERYHQNPQPAIEKATQWRKNNPDRYKQLNNESHRRTRVRKPPPTEEEIKAKEQERKEKRSAYNKAYYQEHREELSKRKSEQYQRKKEAKSQGGETVVFPNPSATPPTA